MNRADGHYLLGSILAVAVPAAILHFSADPVRLTAGLTVSPFAWPRLLVAHLVTVLPLAWVVAQRVTQISSVQKIPTSVWLVVGLLVSILGIVVGPEVGEMVVGLDFDSLMALFIRSMLAFGLVFPWCLATLPKRTGDETQPFWLLLVLTLAAATIPCGFYTDAITKARTQQVNDLLTRERTVRGEVLLSGLLELASERPVQGKAPRLVARELTVKIADLRRTAERTVSTPTAPAARFERALLLIRLDRLNEAVTLLESLEPRTPEISLLLATIDRDLNRLEASSALFEAVWTNSRSQAATDSVARENFMTATEGLLFNYRQQRKPSETESLLKAGLDALPEEAAFFHFQLGQHYADGGRPELALKYLREASQRDPKRFQNQSDEIVRRLQMQTPGCLLRRE